MRMEQNGICVEHNQREPCLLCAIPPVIAVRTNYADNTGVYADVEGTTFANASLPSGNGADEGETKPSNPKDVIGSRKLHMSCVPWTLVVCAARALLEGLLKYGRFNWRMCGVRGSIYLDAIKRHIAKYENGQDLDPKTLVHHLDSAIGCLAIMRDAMLYNKFTDDRPPCPDPDAMAQLIDGEEEQSARLRELFKEHKPYQFTIADTK